MSSFSKIVAGVDLSHADRLISHDLSEACQQAVSKSIELAKASGGELTFFTSIDISEQALHLIETDKEHKSRVEAEAEEVLAELIQKAADEGVTAEAAVAFGKSWEKIIQYVVKNDKTAVVIGRKAKPTFSNFFFGRTAVKLLRKCPVPVYVAKPDPVREVESVLAADDFTEIGADCLDAAVQVARMMHTRLHVVHVIEALETYKLSGSGVAQDDLNRMQNQQTDAAENKLADRLSETDFRTLELGSRMHIEVGAPEVAISKIMKEDEIDVLVLGTNGRSGLAGLVMGNTCERLLAEVDCSLLVIKPRDFKCPVKVD